MGIVWYMSTSSAENKAGTSQWVCLGTGYRCFVQSGLLPTKQSKCLFIGHWLCQCIRDSLQRWTEGTWSGPLRSSQSVRGLTLGWFYPMTHEQVGLVSQNSLTYVWCWPVSFKYVGTWMELQKFLQFQTVWKQQIITPVARGIWKDEKDYHRWISLVVFHSYWRN